MFVGQKVAVKAVEEYVGVAGVGDQVFPSVVALERGFDEDDPRAKAAKVHAAQHGFFVAFNVDFQEVDFAAGGVFFADRGQGAGLDGEVLHVQTEFFALLGDDRVGGGQAGPGNAVEGHFARFIAGNALQRRVARALLAQGVVEVLHRLDVDAAPAAIVERLGYRIVDRIIGADIDVEAVFKELEGAPQAYVFEILCVRDELHGHSLSVRLFLFFRALPARCEPV